MNIKSGSITDLFQTITERDKSRTVGTVYEVYGICIVMVTMASNGLIQEGDINKWTISLNTEMEILIKCLSLAAPEVFEMTSFNTASEENFVKMTFPVQ